MNICPIMRLDDKGAIKAYGKVRGKKKAVEATVNAMRDTLRAAGTMTRNASCAILSVRRTPGCLLTPWRSASPS